MNPLDEGMKVRAGRTRLAYFLPPHHQLGPGVRSPCAQAAGCSAPCEQRQLGLWVWGAAPLATPLGGDGGALLRCQRGARPPPAIQ